MLKMIQSNMATVVTNRHIARLWGKVNCVDKPERGLVGGPVLEHGACRQMDHFQSLLVKLAPNAKNLTVVVESHATDRRCEIHDGLDKLGLVALHVVNVHNATLGTIGDISTLFGHSSFKLQTL
jgi:hypothetical protein